MAEKIQTEDLLKEFLQRISKAVPKADIKPIAYRGSIITTSGRVGEAHINLSADDKKIACSVNSAQFEIKRGDTKEKVEKCISNIISTLRIVS
jgi:hypothetical protein